MSLKFSNNGGWGPRAARVIAAGGEDRATVRLAQSVLDKYAQIPFEDNLLGNCDNFLNDPVCQRCLQVAYQHDEGPEASLLQAFNYLYETNLVYR